MYISDSLGVSALFNILVVLASIGFSWWALQSFRFDVFLKSPGLPQAKILQLILSVILGYHLGKFIIEYAVWSSMLSTLF